MAACEKFYCSVIHNSVESFTLKAKKTHKDFKTIEISHITDFFVRLDGITNSGKYNTRDASTTHRFFPFEYFCQTCQICKKCGSKV